MPMILALNGADFGDFGKAVASAPVAALQRAIRDFGKSVGDSSLVGVVVDGLTGPKTAAAANRVLRQHIGAGQAPAELRTGALTPAQVAANADQITKLVNVEARRRGFGIYVGPPISDKAQITGKTADIAGLQIALKNFGKNVGDKVLAAIVNDGKNGPKTTAAANRMLTAHIGANQAPAILRTGRLTQAQVLVEAARITQLINTEARRRGYGIYIGPPATQKALTALKPAPAARPAATPTPRAIVVRKAAPKATPARREPAAKAPVVQYIPPSQPAAQTPSYIPTTTQTPSYTPTASATPVVVPATKTYVVPPSGGMDVEGVVRWAAIGLGVVALLGGAYFLIMRRRGGGAAPAVAGFGTVRWRGDKRSFNDDERAEWINNDEGLYNWYRGETRRGGSLRAFVRQNRAVIDEAINQMLDRPPRQPGLRGAGPTQKQMYYKAQQRSADGDKTFLDLVRSGMTAPELEALIVKRPELWGRYRSWVRVLPKRAGEGPARFKGALAGAGYYHTSPSEFTPGQRVQLHPGMSLWMQGARYGTVKKIGRDRVHVEIDATGKTVTIPPTRLQIED